MIWWSRLNSVHIRITNINNGHSIIRTSGSRFNNDVVHHTTTIRRIHGGGLLSNGLHDIFCLRRTHLLGSSRHRRNGGHLLLGVHPRFGGNIQAGLHNDAHIGLTQARR
ncbi:unnamed protein product [Prorocentrum cordatum]|uniref:Uncharacterized protein n=1 Tax=Prorocentrum cordatum TaxID=2364126 RepID=A0ABN9Y446_9DINO|nr:unnamed protein product [Polarella glacialis]